jgi:aryl-alcohol dehydrogenase-like predicted oxidoreductase
MRYEKIGSIDNVSVVGLGTWAMGGDFWGAIDEQEAIEAIAASLDNGVTLIDTAPIYGKGVSETIVGKGIKGYARDKVIIATKCGINWSTGATQNNLSASGIAYEVEESLKRLGTDYIDLYQCHWPDRIGTPIAETMEALMKLKKAGKIREIGVSNFSPAQMDECRAAGELASLQPQYSLLCKDIEENGILDYCRKNNVAILSYGSLGAGALTGKFKEPPKDENGDHRANFYSFFAPEVWPKVVKLLAVLEDIATAHGKPVAQVSINWVAQQKGMTCALVGAKNKKQAIMNAEAGSWMLTDDELATIDSEYAKIFG